MTYQMTKPKKLRNGSGPVRAKGQLNFYCLSGRVLGGDKLTCPRTSPVLGDAAPSTRQLVVPSPFPVSTLVKLSVFRNARPKCASQVQVCIAACIQPCEVRCLQAQPPAVCVPLCQQTCTTTCQQTQTNVIPCNRPVEVGMQSGQSGLSPCVECACRALNSET
ncbi:hypothetical protein COOONC_15337 [Cooperia oncophora]